MIKLKRAYEPPAQEDGFRVLVERLWPRGVTKERARIDLWLKDIAPGQELRKWYGHEIGKWERFRERYVQELRSKKELLGLLEQKSREGTVTFIFAARDEQHNSAVVLKEFIEKNMD